MSNIRNLKEYLEAHSVKLTDKQKKDKSLNKKITRKDGRAKLKGHINI